VFVIGQAPAAERLPGLTARAAAVVYPSSGLAIYDFRGQERLPPASTTKIMTAIVAVERLGLDAIIEASDLVTRTPPVKLGLLPGDRLRVQDALYALLLSSANDVASALAENAAGNVAGFVDLMNQQARWLGARDTRFVNANGLPASGHFSTALDLARLFRRAMQIPRLTLIMGTRVYRVPIQGVNARTEIVRTTNRLLGADPAMVAGKTGYTNAAGHCFVGLARQGPHQVIVVVLGSRHLWADVRRLMRHGLGLLERFEGGSRP
jgi:D-alanyl-D-alanine carboxypeptidase (penicillin-binding protein 5/6)